jgi:hypothetical protein
MPQVKRYRLVTLEDDFAEMKEDKAGAYCVYADVEAELQFRRPMPQVGKEVVDRLRAFIREVAPGQCKMMSLGHTCTCPLCDVDRLRVIAHATPGASADGKDADLIAALEFAASTIDDVVCEMTAREKADLGSGYIRDAAIIRAHAERLRLSQPAPDGWVLVPVEPTNEMLIAGAIDFAGTTDQARDCYRAMLDAAKAEDK